MDRETLAELMELSADDLRHIAEEMERDALIIRAMACACGALEPGLSGSVLLEQPSPNASVDRN